MFVRFAPILAELTHFRIPKLIVSAIDRWLERIEGKKLVEFHRMHGKRTSVQDYLTRYHRIRAEGVEASQRIYLDTNFWVNLRRASLNQSGGEFTELLRRLRESVRSRSSICVMHLWPFFEISKQDRASLKASAQLIDELCEGVALVPANELDYWDCGQFVARELGMAFDDSKGRWTWIGRLFKSDLPHFQQSTSANVRLASAKAVVDFLHCSTMMDLVEMFGLNNARLSHPNDIAATIPLVERQKSAQLGRRLSRLAVRIHEFDSTIGKYKKYFVEHLTLLRDLYDRDFSDEDVEQTAMGLMKRASSMFRKGGLGRYLPQLVIQVELYALYERDKLWRLTENDVIDWSHAAAALPNCNIFLTESHLAARLKQCELDQLFGCAVAGDVDEALGLIPG